jgi:hypothetical protein
MSNERILHNLRSAAILCEWFEVARKYQMLVMPLQVSCFERDLGTTVTFVKYKRL